MKVLKAYFPFFIGLLSGLYFISFSVVGTSLTHYPGDLNDGRFCNYLLEHAHLYFNGQLDSFWNAPFMFPESQVISYSDNFIGSVPFYSLCRYLGCDRETAFQGWYIIVTILNYSACYLFLFIVFRNHYAAALGAMVFAFSLALQSQVGHAQTLARYPIPLTFLMAFLFLKELKPVYFFVTLLFLVYQIYCGIYIGFMLIVPVALFFIFSLYFKWEAYKIQFTKFKWRILMFAALILNGLILIPLMLPYLERASSIGLYPYDYVSKSLLTPFSFFFSRDGSLPWDFLKEFCIEYSCFWDHQIFPGGIATLCFLLFGYIFISKTISKTVFLKFEFNSFLQLIFWVGVFTFLFFVRIGNFSLYKILFYLPGFGSMRALQRIINIELLFYAMAVSYIFTYLFRRNTNLTFVLFILCAGLLLIDNYLKQENIHRHEKAESKARVNPLIEQLKDLPKHSVISYEPDSINSSINDYQIDMMLATQSLNLITLNGYTSTSPVGYSSYWSKPNEASRLVWLNTKGIPNQKIVIIK